MQSSLTRSSRLHTERSQRLHDHHATPKSPRQQESRIDGPSHVTGQASFQQPRHNSSITRVSTAKSAHEWIDNGTTFIYKTSDVESYSGRSIFRPRCKLLRRRSGECFPSSRRSQTEIAIFKVFAIVYSETASDQGHAATEDNGSISEVKYAGHYVHTQVRKYVVVRRKREFCYAWCVLHADASSSKLTAHSPIYTYSGNGTAKRGARPQEHGVVHSLGHSPILVAGEPHNVMPAIPVTMVDPRRPLHTASRVYFGLHQAIQYNVKVKEVGRVAQSYLHILMVNWEAVDAGHSVTPDTSIVLPVLTGQGYNIDREVGYSREAEADSSRHRSDTPWGEQSETPPDTICNTQAGEPLGIYIPRYELELVKNPRGFFKRGRVFATLWVEPMGFSTRTFAELARFVVLKSTSSFSICLRISTYSGQATTKPGIVPDAHAAIVPVGGDFVAHPRGEHLKKDPITVRVENPSITIDPMSRINFTKPYSVEHNVMVRNIGRMTGESVGMLDRWFAESLGYTKL